MSIASSSLDHQMNAVVRHPRYDLLLNAISAGTQHFTSVGPFAICMAEPILLSGAVLHCDVAVTHPVVSRAILGIAFHTRRSCLKFIMLCDQCCESAAAWRGKWHLSQGRLTLLPGICSVDGLPVLQASFRLQM